MSVYYNEVDPFAAAWLRELIKIDAIAPGEVDERSIEDVRPQDLKGFSQCHFFAGIGVWSLALREAGWPDSRPAWTGSCPCQPFSAAGKRKGTADERHLWPAWQWLIGKCRPDTVFGEQVASRDGLAWFDTVSTDMEGCGYAVGSTIVPAAGFGAPHARHRLFFVADSVRSGRSGERCDDGERFETTERAGCKLGGVAYDSSKYGRLSDVTRKDDLETVGNSQAASLADIESDGREQGCEVPRRGHQRGDEVKGSRSSDDCESCELGDASGAGSRGNTGSLSGSQKEGKKERRSDGLIADKPVAPGPTNGHWGGSEWIYCRDGKWRPIEPGTQPLAHGVTGRVGKLRGYGNAIVAQAAEEFIKACKEVTDVI